MSSTKARNSKRLGQAEQIRRLSLMNNCLLDMVLQAINDAPNQRAFIIELNEISREHLNQPMFEVPEEKRIITP